MDDAAVLGIKISTIGAREALSDLDALTLAGRRLETATGMLKAALGGLAAGFASIGLGNITQAMTRLADTWSTLNSRLVLVSASTGAASRAMNELYAVAQRTRADLGATVDLYARLSTATASMGVSSAQIRQVTESVSQALVISGTSAAAAAGSLTQLGQAMASGSLRGDELNSVLEGMPRLAKAIADGMGVTVGQLRALGAEGKITSADLFNAIMSQSAALQAEFNKMPVTVDQAMTRVQNAVLQAVGRFDQATGLSRALAEAISGLSLNLDKFAAVAAGLVAAGAVAALPALLGAIAAGLVAIPGIMATAWGAVVANPILLVAAAVGALAASMADARADAMRADEVLRQAKATIDEYGKAAQTSAGSTTTLGQQSLGAAMGVKAFGGAAGEAAVNLFNMAAQAKSAAINAIFAKQAMVQAELAEQKARSRAGRRVIDLSSPGSTVSGGLGLLAGDMQSWWTGGQSDRDIDNRIAELEKASRDLNALAAQVASTSTESFAKAGAAAASAATATAGLAKAHKDSIDPQLESAAASDIVAINLESVAVKAVKVTGEIEHVSEKVGSVRFDTWVDEIDTVSDAFLDARRAADSVFAAIEEKDWAGALGGIIRLVQQIADAFNGAGTAVQKIGAVGGALGGIGSAVGGRAGSIISGIGGAASLYSAGSVAGTALINAGSMGALGGLSGAAMGLGSILGPLGAVVGIASLFMKDDSAKKAQAYADAIKANEAALAALNQKRELELQLMEAQGRTAEALAFRRADELASMDAASAAMQAQIWALEDLAAATEKANSAYDDAVAAASNMVDAARSDLVDAYNEEASALKSTIETFSRLVETLRAFGDSLSAQAASVASPLTAFRQSQGAFRATAASNDPNVLANLPATGQAYLQAALAIAPDKTTYQRVLAEVRRATAEAEKTAERQKTIAEQQLDELKTQVSLLVSIDKGIMSVSAAIAALAVAQATAAAQIAAAASARDAAVAAANDNGSAMWSASGYAAKNPDVAAWAQTVLGTKGYDGQVLSTIDQALSYHWLNHGKFEGRSFATGGSFDVGGSSFSGDRVPVNMMLNSGEHVNVSRQDSVGRLAAAQERQNALLADQTAEMRKSREATERTERLLRRLSEGGTSLRTTAA